MLDRVIAFSLRNRWMVLLAALAVATLGLIQLSQMPVDVFPDLNRPTVTIMTEASGLAPEEVEILVTRPLEFLLNGATNVRRVRSSSAVAHSIVWVEFDWGTDIYQDRQIVGEKLQLARDRLPPGVNPILAPISSIMGEIMLIGLRADPPGTTPQQRSEQAIQLRTLGEFTVRNRLLSVEGVAQVTVLGGVLKQFQIVTSPARLASQGISLQQLVEAGEKANVLAGGGVLEQPNEERLIRINALGLTLNDIAATTVVWRDQRSIRIGDVADVRFGGPVRRGDGGFYFRNVAGQFAGGDTVILAVQKQPNANTLALTPKIDEVLDQLHQELPSGVVVEKHLFRQADFIQTAIDNVVEAIRDGAIWVIVILFLFLANLRTSLITLTALPLSILITVLVFRIFGITINTMTLGGIAVAVGELVDDAIIDVENIFRRLKQNRQLATPEPAIRVILHASSEIRNSIVYATLIVCLVVFPLFALGGLEGRMFAPLGLAYITALMASLVVSLTVTPALAAVCLPRARFLERPGDSWLLRWLKYFDEKLIRWALRHPRKILIVVAMLAIGSKLMVFWMGSEFLPPFNEGTLTINVQLSPGTSLTESIRLAERAGLLLFDVPEVISIARRTGRAEQDEHAEGVYSSDLEVRLRPHQQPNPGALSAIMRAIPGLHSFGTTTTGRPADDVLADVRERLARLPGVAINIGQPIAHRLDHVMSGIRAQIAVKVFGPDLRVLVETAHDVQERMSHIPGVVDLTIEPQENVKQVRLDVDRRAAALYGLAPGDVVRMLETAYKGRVVSTVLDGDRYFDLVVWFDEPSRNDPGVIGQTILDTPSGRKVALGQVARVLDARGPNTINREQVERRVAVACNVQGRDLGSVVEDIRQAIAPVLANTKQHTGNYHIEIGGQFDAQQQANRLLFWLAWLAIAGVFVLLWKCLESWVAAAMVLLVNLPLAALGSVIALMLINLPHWDELMAAPFWQWPRIWASETTLSVAHWVGFITLIGIVSRNGIMMIAHYIHLMKHEGEPFGPEMIVRGSLERLAPVLMTALTAVIGLVPLALGAGQTGKEILHPLAIVVIGGLLDSTLMDQIVTPAVFSLFGKYVYDPAQRGTSSQETL